MSNLSAKTEKKALVILAKAVLLFDRLNDLDIASDAFYARQAENILHSIIENNGYRLARHAGKKSAIILPDA